MIDGRRVLAVVPARGGSKGIKLKNLTEVGGVPLVARAGHIASQVAEIDRAIVSTDHSEIAEVARQSGLGVPFMRPQSLSGDRVADWDVLHHALVEMERIDGQTYDIIVMLQPTSPSRTPDDVRRTLACLVEGEFDAVWTVSETDSKGHPLKQLTISADGKLDYYDPRGAHIIARQQLTPVYHRNGIAYAISRDCLMSLSSIKGKKTGAVVIDRAVANIDTILDLEIAELLMKESDPAGARTS